MFHPVKGSNDFFQQILSDRRNTYIRSGLGMHPQNQTDPFQTDLASSHKHHLVLFVRSSDVRRWSQATRSHLYPEMQFRSFHKYHTVLTGCQDA